jgi:hypothetical protein
VIIAITVTFVLLFFLFSSWDTIKQIKMVQGSKTKKILAVITIFVLWLVLQWLFLFILE